MKVTVLFFGATADITGRRKAEFDAQPASTSRDLFDRVLNEHPRLASHRLLYSVNEQYASGVETLSDGDEMAIFTAVSGG